VTALLARAVLAFLALPVTVAFVVPALLLDGRLSVHLFDPVGLIPVAVGLVLLLVRRGLLQ
jgi:hypothetical protein